MKVRSVVLYGIVILGCLGAFNHFSRKLNPYRFADNQNYEILWSEHVGWKKLSPGPQQLFMYSDRETNIRLIGSVSRIMDEVNPTPELDTDGLADLYIGTTRENMKGWSAERHPDFAGQERFSMILREGPDRTTWTAFVAKGNTTLIVSMGANGAKRSDLEALMPRFRAFLADVEFRPKTYAMY
ncbi:MAG: hypothetical protein K8H99_09480 [Nitrospirae bacterium]|nr:hypothetical protein [Fimbriimonadaceae bacterium]